MERAYCLYRVSDRGQVEKNDIPMQKIACHSFAKCHGWEIKKEFSEKGVSGYRQRMDERDAILQIKEDSELGKFDILLVFMFDRIGRRDDETPFVVEWMVKRGIAVWSVCEGEQRFDNHVDKLTNYIRYWQAAGESERISERTRTRIRQLTSEGVFTGGVCPYGYELIRQGRENKKGQPLYDLVIQPDEAKVVQFIFEKTALEGCGAYRLAKLLDEMGAHPKSGRPWNPATLYGILRNPLYAGLVHKGDATSYQADLRIIDDDLFRDAQELREARGKGKAAEPTVPVMKGTALLSGFLYCETCGSRMSSNHVVRHRARADGTTTKSRTQRYYCCQRAGGIPCKCSGQHTYVAAEVDRLLMAQLSTYLTPLLARPANEQAAEVMAPSAADIRKRLAEVNAKRHTVIAELDVLQHELVACLNGTSDFPHKQISATLAKTEATIAQLDEERHALKLEEDALAAMTLEKEFQIKKYQNLWGQVADTSLEKKKIILSHFIESVKISKGYRLKIEFNRKFFAHFFIT